ncbi:MAG: hypothetical protein HWN81_09885 [Candidatus Lokiarchaeota archaeon]|nr:hypothetical protein [Candidatus Lokiarchaeota archaeon]
MEKGEQQSVESVSEEEVPREEIKFQYFWYLIVFFSIYLISLVVPAIIFMTYVILFFVPQFLEITDFFALFTEIDSVIALITMPFVIIGCYLIRLFLIGLVTRWLWSLSEKKSPSKNGIIPRNFSSKALNYYHIRSFMIKYGKNAFSKGVFAWLSNWFFNFVKSNKIGKGTTLEESIMNDKFAIIGNNCYFGVNSALASHLVDGTFGNINYFQIKIGDNVTSAATNLIAAGSEVHDNSYLLPLASTPKHSVIKGNNYYWGLPLRKIFRKKIMNYLGLTPKDLEINENIEGYRDIKLLKKLKTEINTIQTVDKLKKENFQEDDFDVNSLTANDLKIDFTTSSAISRINIKFLAVYLPIFWLSGMIVTIVFYTFTSYIHNWILMAFFLPAMVVIMWFVFIIGCFFFSKLFLLLINLIHKPKEGIFKAEIGNTDFEFWCLRTELKKIVLWLMRNWPLPWMDILAFKWFGIRMTLSSSLYDSWCDSEFITFGRRVLVGQGATINSSMVLGKYLIIKRVICGDYSLIGGHTTIAPGSVIGKDTFVSAISNTVYNQILEPGWIYLGIPVIKMKKNKYARERRDIIMRRDVDEEKKFEIEHKSNLEEDKKDIV